MIVIGDVHGCFKTLKALINKLPKDDKICFVGDLIDRGPSSMDVVQYVIDNNFDCVLGNHEQFMIMNSKITDQINRETDQSIIGLWGCNGGTKTIESYTSQKIFNDHVKWMKELPLLNWYKELVVSHSSCANYVLEYTGDKDDVLWRRPENPKAIPGRFNIFGHTPKEKPLIEEHFACIDTACVFKNKLTALQYPSMKIFQQEYID